MRKLLFFLILGVVVTGCVEEEEILAYKYDPDRLCLIDPRTPIIVATREVREPADHRTLLFVSFCSVNEENGLVSFQKYFLKGFVECSREVWGDVYFEAGTAGWDVSQIACVD